MPAPGLNLLVFRDHKRVASSSSLKHALAQQLLEASSHSAGILSALLQAGELECALADSGALTTRFETITESLAAALVDGSEIPNVGKLLDLLYATAAPRQLTVSVPEGFAFYALHPLAYAGALQSLLVLPSRVAVVGIRSIGATLSAVVAAAVRHRGIEAVRTTVRPIGHPYNRYTELSPSMTAFVQGEISRHATFLVVDEGPGLSGSSFLSVAEALARAGTPKNNIRLVCAHAPQPDRLCAENAASRWRQFQSVVVPSLPLRPSDAQVWIGGGEWRRYLLRAQHDWPCSWLNFERSKYLSGHAPQPRFYKFAGLGCYGEAILRREQHIAAAGFAPFPKLETDGYVSYPFIDGRPMRGADLSESVLARLAAYCAFRRQSFAAEVCDVAALQQMVGHNLQELQVNSQVNLRLERPVVPDGRMQPHEWLLSCDGQMLKTDSGAHGDDHFFPGAADIAWDLAGTIVEWQMNAVQTGRFLEIYQRAAGDDASARIDDYITAYSVFRGAYCTMAASAMQGTEEQKRLEQAAANLGHRLQVIGHSKPKNLCR